MILKEFQNQLAKNVKKQPGWVPLVLACYLAILCVAPEGGKYLEFVTVAAAFVFYELADAVDKAIFNRVERRWVASDRDAARGALGVGPGIYRVSRDLLDAADEYQGSWIQVQNEIAKFSRSAVVPAFLLFAIQLYRSSYLTGIVCLVCAAVLGVLYVQLKSLHMQRLYRRAVELSADQENYDTYDLPMQAESRLFFWNGQLVSSVRLRTAQPAA